jgi:protein-disulfide isomerase
MNQARNISTAGRRALLLALSGILLFAFAWMLAGHTEEAMAASQPGSAAPASGSERAAVVEGEAITFSEVEASAAERLEQREMQRLQMEHQLSQQRQQMLLDTLSEVVEERLVALEARAEGLTPEELLEQRVQVAPVTDEEIEAFYQELVQQRPQGVPPKERIEGQIRSHLQEARQTEARESFFGQLREKYAVEVFLQEPRVEVAADGFPSKGPADAPVTIVEFSDFQCSFCARVVPTLNRVLETYGDKVRLVYRNFPLTGMHTHAQKAAEASLCAREQGKFWEMHDLMFAEQQRLSVPELKDKARRLGLDGERFDECLDSDRHAEAVKKDAREGMVVGVSGTPAFFVNGRFISGAVPFEQLAEVIDAELEKVGVAAGG